MDKLLEILTQQGPLVAVLVGFGIGMFVLFRHAILTMDPQSDFEDPDPDHMSEDHMK